MVTRYAGRSTPFAIFLGSSLAMAEPTPPPSRRAPAPTSDAEPLDPPSTAAAPESAAPESAAPTNPRVSIITEQPLPARPPAKPRVHHAPLATATSGRALEIRINIDYPHAVERALLIYRTATKPQSKEVEFKRGVPSPYIAVVPAADVTAPWLDYRIELEPREGERVAAFASKDAMHRVQTAEPLEDIRERALAERLEQRRSQFFATSEYVDFGQSDATVAVALNDGMTVSEQRSVRDRYVRVEGGYTYRPLRTVFEFSLRAGIVRGESPVPTGELAPGQDESERFRVGLNYGAPTARFTLAEQVHADVEFLASVTEVGFSVGTGAALVLGDPLGTSLTAGFETIQVFGTRIYTRMNTVLADGIELAPIIEVSDMPHASKYGVRLLGETSFELGSGFEVAARGGYQARTFTAGGPSAGVSVGYGF